MRDAQIDEPAVITSDHGRNDCFGDQERCPKFLSDSMFESIDAQSGEGSALVWSSSVMYQHLNGTPVVGDRVGHLGDIFGASEISLHDKGVAAVIVDGVGYVMGFDGVVFVMDSDPIATLAEQRRAGGADTAAGACDQSDTAVSANCGRSSSGGGDVHEVAPSGPCTLRPRLLGCIGTLGHRGVGAAVASR